MLLGGIRSRMGYVFLGLHSVMPSHRLAPENKLPVSMNDARDSLRWLDEHASGVKVDLSQGFMDPGTSAGATNTACVVPNAREKKLLPNYWSVRVCHRYRASNTSQNNSGSNSGPTSRTQKHPFLPPTTSSRTSLYTHAEWDWDSPWRLSIVNNAPLPC